MSSLTKFTPEVIDEIKYYVYKLIDPRDGNIFYVGKGKGNRVFDHLKASLDFKGEEDEQTEKIGTIRSILNAGLEPIHIIHRHGIEDEKTAFEVEAALIDSVPGLSNVVSGHGSNDRGPSNAKLIQEMYSVEQLSDDEITEKMIIIKVKQSSIDSQYGDIYEATRKHWKISISGKAVRCEYAISSVNGLIKEIYNVENWVESDLIEGRYMFNGTIAPQEIRDRYIGKRIPPKFMRKGLASPTLYTF